MSRDSQSLATVAPVPLTVSPPSVRTLYPPVIASTVCSRSGSTAKHSERSSVLFVVAAVLTEFTRPKSRPPTDRDSARSSSVRMTWPSLAGSRRGWVSRIGQRIVTPGGVGFGRAAAPPGTDITGSGSETAASRAWPP